MVPTVVRKLEKGINLYHDFKMSLHISWNPRNGAQNYHDFALHLF